jgi:D-alanyl-D-alanine carboxypeptidase
VALVAAVVLGAIVLGPGALGAPTWSGASPHTDATLPACRVADRPAKHTRYSDWATTLLDTEFMLPPEYVPPDLVPVAEAGIDGAGTVRVFVIDDLAALAASARQAGVRLEVESAYRSFEDQRRTFESLQGAYGRAEALLSAARPGHSEHQLGTTIDFEGGETWLAANAWRFGFVVSYPDSHSPRFTCYKPEPWHLRYMGRPSAAEVQRSGLSLREWLWQREHGATD